jgi:tRNA modification GTPase
MVAHGDTIIAPASGAAPAGVCVIRASGPQAGAVVSALAGPLPQPRRASLRRLRDGEGRMIDTALVLWFPGPTSFTGEDCAEFHLHGGKAVIEATLEAALAVPGVRLAEPGGFTRRAYENGRMDLSAAEGLADLIEAETEAQRVQALRQMEGGLARVVDGWREAIVSALADAEADIDFPDEDLPPGLSMQARNRIGDLRAALASHLAGADAAQRVRDGFSVAILGPPNAGKSSLLNALAGRDAAIVSPIPGTTRDVVEVRLVLAGAVVWLADTAGLREAGDAIEAEGVRRAFARAHSADLRIGVVAHGDDPGETAALLAPSDLLVRSKADLADDGGSVPQGTEFVSVSVVDGLGIEALLAAIGARASAAQAQSVAVPLTRLRHREAVVDAIAALDRALSATGPAVELAAEDLRLAARALGRIIGRVDVEDVLDRLFAQFCIGK